MSATDPNSPPFNLVYADSIAARVARGGYGYVGKMGVTPGCYTVTAAGVPSMATGAAGNQPWAIWGNGPFAVPVECYVGVAGTARLPFGNITEGLQIEPNLVDNNNVEYVIGGNNNLNPFAYVVGTSPSSFLRVTLKLPTANAYDQLVVGWRRVQAFDATASFITGVNPKYTDFAAIGFAGTVAAANPIRTITDVNGTGSSQVINTVGFTWADGLTHQLAVRINGRKPLFMINQAALGNRITKDGLGNTITAQSTNNVAQISLDTGDVMVPFIFVRADTAIGASKFVHLVELEVGRLADIGLSNSERGGVVD